MRLAILLSALLQQSQPLQTRPSLRRATRLHAREDAYASYWDELLLKEYREAAAELRSRRQTWSRKRLEDSGDSVFGTATPESELFGDKIVRVTRRSGRDGRLRDRFRRGDVLLLSPEDRAPRDRQFLPRDVVVVDAGADWLAVGAGAR
ncbi:hypothetical protein SO694_0031303, partial [Aureococcus anophagefferens]